MWQLGRLEQSIPDLPHLITARSHRSAKHFYHQFYHYDYNSGGRQKYKANVCFVFKKSIWNIYIVWCGLLCIFCIPIIRLLPTINIHQSICISIDFPLACSPLCSHRGPDLRAVMVDVVVSVWWSHHVRPGQPRPPHQGSWDGVFEGGLRSLRQRPGRRDQHGGTRKGEVTGDMTSCVKAGVIRSFNYIVNGNFPVLCSSVPQYHNMIHTLLSGF